MPTESSVKGRSPKSKKLKHHALVNLTSLSPGLQARDAILMQVPDGIGNRI